MFYVSLKGLPRSNRKFLFTLCWALAASAHGATSWTQLRTPHFEIVSNAGPAQTRQAALAAVQIARALLDRPARPITIFLLTPGLYIPYRPKPDAVGFYFPGLQTDYIALHSNSADPAAVLFHEFAHLAQHQRGDRVPAWFAEGLAEIYSSAKVFKTSIRIGDPIPQHLAAVLKGDTANPYSRNWSLAHLLYLSPAYSPKLAQFLDAMVNGATRDEALAQVYRKTPRQFETELLHYLKTTPLPTQTIRLDPPEPAGKPHPQPISAAEASRALADFELSLGKLDAARSRFEALDDAEALAHLALRQGEPAEALRQFDRAIARKPKPELIAERNLLIPHPPPAPLAAKPQPAIPLERLDGKLIELDCADGPQLVVATAARRYRFPIPNPTRIALNGLPDSTETFACGPLSERPVTVEYLPPNDLRVITFR